MTHKVERDLIKTDLFQAVNGAWLETAVIPDDKPTTGGFSDLADKVEADLMKDLADLIDQPDSLTKMQKEMVAYYQLALDKEGRAALGMSPLRPYIERIQALTSVADLTEWAKTGILEGLPGPFGLGVIQDMADSNRYVVHLGRPGLILPDRTYYEPDHAQGQQLLAVYRQVALDLLALLGMDVKEAVELVAAGMAFDARLAPYTLSKEEAAEYVVFHNPRKLDQVAAYSDQIDFKAVLESVLGGLPETLNVGEPKFFEAFKELVDQADLTELKAWLTLRLVTGATSYLSEEARAISHRMTQALTGNPAMRPFEKLAYSHVNQAFDQVLGDFYAQRYFGPEAKEDVTQMVKNMIAIYQKRLETKEWLSPATREKAILKLQKMDLLVGYPDKIPPVYEELVVGDRNFFQASIYFTKVATRYNLSKWNKPVDRDLWELSANTVNAYYDPSNNLICFPAAILQAPFYSLQQSASANYGGIGAVIAHEISHAFDNNGAQFDETGSLSNWWTEEDLAHFNSLADKMIKLWDGIPFGDGKINGTLTVSENIADAGGLSCALEAAQALPDADLEDFFFNWARVWCRKARPEYVNLLLNIDVHSPGELRANMAPKNLAAFYETFGIEPGDAMYLAPEDRVTIW